MFVTLSLSQPCASAALLVSLRSLCSRIYLSNAEVVSSSLLWIIHLFNHSVSYSWKMRSKSVGKLTLQYTIISLLQQSLKSFRYLWTFLSSNSDHCLAKELLLKIDPDVIWPRNLPIWSQTRYRCATRPILMKPLYPPPHGTTLVIHCRCECMCKPIKTLLFFHISSFNKSL